MTKRFNIAGCSEAQLWRHVATHLERRGIGVTLVGGAVVAVYTAGAYRSGDLDFVEDRLFGSEIEEAMAELGFQREARHFVHPECSHLFVEFVSGPLGIGDDTGIVPSIDREGPVPLKILSPTDCVRDRLASYIHFQARECLDQAVLVARAQQIDWHTIQTWCQREGPKGAAAYEDLHRLVNPAT